MVAWELCGASDCEGGGQQSDRGSGSFKALRDCWEGGKGILMCADWHTPLFHHTPGNSAFIEMMRGATKVMRQCAAVQAGEKVVIASDTNKMRIAEVLAAAAVAEGGIPIIVMIPPTGAHGAQPPSPLVAALKESNVYVLATTYNLQHTDARIEALRAGSRGTTMPEVTEDLLITGGILADYEACDKVGRALGQLLEKTSVVRIRTARGTDVRGQVKGRRVIYETGLFRNPGQYAALPDSEINISPIEGTAEGTVIVDVRLGPIGVPGGPLTIELKDGEVRDVQGGREGEAFWELLDRWKDRTAFNVAEFAMGLNPSARLYATFLEDEGHLGNGHIGIGSNYSIGGKIKAPLHVDVIFRDAVIEFDGRVVYDRGQVTI